MKLEIDIPNILYQDAKENRNYISLTKLEIAWKIIADGKPLEQESTTKNDLVTLTFSKGILKYSCKDYVVYKRDWLRSHYGAEIDIMFGDSQYKEPTTKNDLGVDCISRADARSLICKIDIKHHLSGMSRKTLKDLYNGMDELPSVTPQERKGHWKEEFSDLEGEVRFTCSSCGKYQLFGTDFCYHCGAKMVEPQESEG